MNGSREMCTLEKRGNIFLLTITGQDQHRLNPDRIDAIRSALHRVRSDPTSSSSALITTSEGKFFSNGYDLDWMSSSPSSALLMSSKLRSLVTDLISLPMPTIAAVTGHASAAGFILALSHDYIVMRRDRGFLYMSEMDIGLVIPAWFVSIVRSKIGSPAVRRNVVLRADKITGKAAVEGGIVDSAHDGAEETVEAAVVLGEKVVRRGFDGHVYGRNREEMMKEVLSVIGFDETVEDVLLTSRIGSKL